MPVKEKPNLSPSRPSESPRNPEQEARLSILHWCGTLEEKNAAAGKLEAAAAGGFAGVQATRLIDDYREATHAHELAEKNMGHQAHLSEPLQRHLRGQLRAHQERLNTVGGERANWTAGQFETARQEEEMRRNRAESDLAQALRQAPAVQPPVEVVEEQARAIEENNQRARRDRDEMKLMAGEEALEDAEE